MYKIWSKSKLINSFSIKYKNFNTLSGPAQAMLYSLNLDKNDINKQHLGIGAVWFEGNPCNVKLNKLSLYLKNKIKSNDNNLLPFRFSSVGVSDGITMGTYGMKYSLPSRELISNSFETIAGAHNYGGLVCIPGCDKNLPGVLMAMCTLDIPSMIIYGGSMPPGKVYGKDSDIVTAFEAYGSKIKKEINDEEYDYIVQNCCNKECGSCSGLYTANTMATIFEVMGLTLQNSSSNISMSKDKMIECDNSVPIIENLVNNKIKPSDILTKESFINGIKMLYCTGGSTNAIIHLMAIAKTMNIDIDLDDFNKFSDTPVLLNMKPHGDYMMYHLYKIGGTSLFIKYLINIGIINGKCLTITGKTLEENVKKYSNIDFQKQDIIYPIENPFKKNSHIQILKGNLAKNGCITKIYSNKKYYEGNVLVYDTEDDMINSLTNGEITKEKLIIIRGQGETTGCPEMLKPTSALVGYFGGEAPPLLTDGRFSGGSRGVLIAHLDDMYKEDSITGYIKNGDKITIDLVNNNISLDINNEELEKRKNQMNIFELKPKFNGYLNLYSKYVGDINSGFSII